MGGFGGVKMNVMKSDEKTQSTRVNGVMGINNRKNVVVGYLLMSGLIASFLTIGNTLPFDPTIAYMTVIVLLFVVGQLYFYVKNGYYYSDRVQLDGEGLVIKKATGIPILPLTKDVMIPYGTIERISLKSHEGKWEMSRKGKAVVIMLVAGAAIVLSALTLAEKLSVASSAILFLVILGTIGIVGDSLRYGISSFISGRTTLERLGLYDITLELASKTDEFEKEVHIYSPNGDVIFEKINGMLDGR